MTLCIDSGNSFIKIAVFEHQSLKTIQSFSVDEINRTKQWLDALLHIDRCIVSDVGSMDDSLKKELTSRIPFYMELTADTPIPIHNLYSTPHTLGKDRLAAVVGAHTLYPGRNVLVIDAGTAITYDFLDDAGNFRGGNISPGIQMRFQALNHFTKKLPLLSVSEQYSLLGQSTDDAIISGVQNGIVFEVEGYINKFKRDYSDLIALVTGGDTFFFVKRLGNCIFVESDLIFKGLLRIIDYNN